MTITALTAKVKHDLFCFPSFPQVLTLIKLPVLNSHFDTHSQTEEHLHINHISLGFSNIFSRKQSSDYNPMNMYIYIWLKANAGEIDSKAIQELGSRNGGNLFRWMLKTLQERWGYEANKGVGLTVKRVLTSLIRNGAGSWPRAAVIGEVSNELDRPELQRLQWSRVWGRRRGGWLSRHWMRSKDGGLWWALKRDSLEMPCILNSFPTPLASKFNSKIGLLGSTPNLLLSQ